MHSLDTQMNETLLATAAFQSASALAQEVERQQIECDCPPRSNFVFDYQQLSSNDCDCGNSQSQNPSKSRKNANNSLRLLDSLMDLIKSDSTIERELRQARNCSSSCGPKLSFGLKQRLFSHVGEAVLPLMREEYVWEGGERKTAQKSSENSKQKNLQ